MKLSTSALPTHYQLPEFMQTHVHRVSDAIQPSHPLSSPSPPASNPPQHQGLFQWVNSSHEVAKYKSFSFNISPSNEYPGLISFRMDWLDLLVVQGTLKSLLQHHSSKASFFLVLIFLHSPTLTSTHDHWKNHSLDWTVPLSVSYHFDFSYWELPRSAVAQYATEDQWRNNSRKNEEMEPK